MANPAAAPMAAMATSWLQPSMLAEPAKALADGLVEAMVPLVGTGTTPVDTRVPAWICPSPICLTGVTVDVAA